MILRTVPLRLMLLALLPLLAALPAAAQTMVPGGTISTDTTWILGGSPYQVQGTLTIQGNDGPDGVTTLTIEPGVTVEIQGLYFIYVGGTATSAPGALVADGNAGGGPATINFTSSGSTPGDWNGIQFRRGARNTSVLRNVLVEFAGGTSWAGVYMDQETGVTIPLDEITVRNSGNYGIQFNRGDIALSDCVVESNQDFDLQLSNVAMTGSVTGCTSIESLFYAGTSSQVDWTGNSFNNWGTRTSRVDPDDAASLGGNTFDAPATLELVTGTVVRDGSWSTAPGSYVTQGTLTVQGSDGADAVTTLTLEPGVEVRMGASDFFYVGGTSVGIPGALIADGNVAGGPATIVFTSSATTPATGDWTSLQFRRGARGTSVLRNVLVEYGGRSGWAGVYMNQETGVTIPLDEITVRNSGNYGIQFNRGDIALSDCVVESNQDFDLQFGNVAMTGSVTGCTSIESLFYVGTSPQVDWTGNSFNNWGARTSRVDPDDAASLAGNTFDAPATLELVTGTVVRDGSWSTAPGSYVTQGTLTVQGSDGADAVTTLTLEPGVEVRMGASDFFYVGGTSVGFPGALVADGNAAGGPSTIVFTSSATTPATGDWTSLQFRRGARNTSVLRNVLVEYGGRSGWAGVYMNQETGVTIPLDEITVRNSGNYGIQFNRGDIALSDCVVESNQDFDLQFGNVAMTGSVTGCTSIESLFYVGTSPQVDWTGNSFNNWGARTSRVDPDDAASLAGNTFDAPATLELVTGTVVRDGTWSTAPGSYVTQGTLTVQGSDGADAVTTLTLEPGVEVRMGASDYFYVGGTSAGVPGALIADGDAAGGPATILLTSAAGSPAAGDWNGLHLRRGARGNSLLRDLTVRYAGGSGNYGIYLNNDTSQTMVLDDVTVRDSANYGIYANYGMFDIDNCTVEANQNHDFYIVSNANVSGTVNNCSTVESVFYTGSLSDVSWGSNVFNNWGARVSRIPPDLAGAFGANNTFNKVPDADLELLTGTVTLDATWILALADAFIPIGAVSVQGTDGGDGVTTLTLDPGVTIRFRGSQLFNIGGTSAGIPGALVADGDAAGGPATILFTTDNAMPAAGAWQAIYFRAGARDNSLLRNVRVEYAGSGGWAGLWFNHSAGSIGVTDVVIEDSATYGVYVSGEVALDQLVVRRAGSNAIYVQADPFTLSNCTLEDNTSFDVSLNGASVATVQNCNAIESVFYSAASPDVVWTGNTFNNWGALTSRVEPEAIGNLIADNTINLAGGAMLDVTGGNVESDGAWTDQIGNPYIIRGGVTIEGTDGVDAVTTVTMAPGLQLRFAGSHLFSVGGTIAANPGALVADGNAAGGPATIVFTSNQPGPSAGDWQSLYFRPGAGSGSLLRNVRIEYAGDGNWAGVWLTQANGAVTLSDVAIADSSYYGIYATGDATLEQLGVSNCANNGLYLSSSSFSLDGCTIESNGGHDFALHGSTTGSVQNCATIESIFYANALSDVTWMSNTFNNWGLRTSQVEPEAIGSLIADNTINAVGGAELAVTSGTVVTDAGWTAAAGNPYLIEGIVAIDGTDGGDGVTTVTLDPGMQLHFVGSQQLAVGGTIAANPGALVADGNAAGGPATIVFTSANPSPAAGDWQTIYFRPGARSNSLLRNVRIEYAGSGGWAGAWLAQDASQTINLEEITIRDSSNFGVYASGPFAVDGCTIESNANWDFFVTTPAGPTNSVQNCTSIESLYTSSTTSRTSWNGNTFNNWGSRTSRTNLADLGELSTANTFNPVPSARLEVYSGTLAQDATWGPGPGPFDVQSGAVTVSGTDGADARTTLTLEPGVTIRMTDFAAFNVGNSSGDPGELIADGRLAGGLFDKVNFNSSNDTPAAGSWNGLYVRNTGRAELYETQIRYAATAVRVDGTLGAFDRVVVNRADVGLELVTATVEQDLSANDFKNTGTALRASGTGVTIRDSNIVGSIFGAQNLTPGTACVDAALNWWGDVSGPSGSDLPSGCELDAPTGIGSAISAGVNFDTPLSVPPDDGDSIPCDDGDGFGDPCTGGNTIDCDDNCCFVANESQADLDIDGTGDACDTNPVLRVSSDPLDLADFAVVQDAVDATFQSGSRIEVLSGLGPYNEAVRVDREQVYTFEGVETAGPVAIDGGAGPAFRVINKAGLAPMRFRTLTLQGNQGLRSAVDCDLVDIDFTMIAQEALELDAGSTRAERCSIDSPAVGARVSSLADLTFERVTVTGTSDAGLVLDGTATLQNVLITDGVDGIRVSSTGSLDAGYTTIADNTGYGVENDLGGVAIDRSILWNNALDDLAGVACGSLGWSSTGFPDCSAGGDNIVGDPLLEPDFSLGATSPCLDHGPDPATYTGEPPTDIDGGPRLFDHDGDGLARNDCGAYERTPSLTPGAVQNLRWDLSFRLLWDAEPSATEYHVYRDLRANLSFASYGVCRDDLDPGRTDTQLDDMENPNADEIFFYLITAEDSLGEEGTLGFGTRAERSNFGPCP